MFALREFPRSGQRAQARSVELGASSKQVAAARPTGARAGRAARNGQPGPPRDAPAVGVIRRGRHPGERADEREATHARGAAARVRDRERAALGEADEDRAGGPHRVEYRVEIVHALRQRGQRLHAIARARAALVEQDDARVRRELPHERPPRAQRERGPHGQRPPEHEHDVDRPGACRAVRNVDVAAADPSRRAVVRGIRRVLRDLRDVTHEPVAVARVRPDHPRRREVRAPGARGSPRAATTRPSPPRPATAREGARPSRRRGRGAGRGEDVEDLRLDPTHDAPDPELAGRNVELRRSEPPAHALLRAGSNAGAVRRGGPRRGPCVVGRRGFRRSAMVPCRRFAFVLRAFAGLASRCGEVLDLR